MVCQDYIHGQHPHFSHCLLLGRLRYQHRPTQPPPRQRLGFGGHKADPLGDHRKVWWRAFNPWFPLSPPKHSQLTFLRELRSDQEATRLEALRWVSFLLGKVQAQVGRCREVAYSESIPSLLIPSFCPPIFIPYSSLPQVLEQLPSLLPSLLDSLSAGSEPVVVAALGVRTCDHP